MIGISIDKSRTFFDKAFVEQSLDPATRRTLSADGALLRRSSRRSMRSKDGAAAKGKPPHRHKKDKDHPKGPLVYDRLFFAYEPDAQAVIVGPELLGDSHVLTTLEETNPFMRPALEREKDKLARPYAD
ncbi:MAG: hypothetical protein K8U03_09230 [Planctomycetia bacterium]|nr:hypothetical protein [Planctomycetia bacterium]